MAKDLRKCKHGVFVRLGCLQCDEEGVEGPPPFVEPRKGGKAAEPAKAAKPPPPKPLAKPTAPPPPVTGFRESNLAKMPTADLLGSVLEGGKVAPLIVPYADMKKPPPRDFQTLYDIGHPTLLLGYSPLGDLDPWIMWDKNQIGWWRDEKDKSWLKRWATKEEARAAALATKPGKPRAPEKKGKKK